MDVVSREGAPDEGSANEDMLETEGGTMESDVGFTDTAEPAAAGEQFVNEIKYINSNDNVFLQLSKLSIPSRDCDDCIELNPFCGTRKKTNSKCRIQIHRSPIYFVVSQHIENMK